MNSLIKSEHNFNSIPIETIEEMLVYRADFHFIWDNPNKLHFVALVIDKGNILEDCKDALDDYLTSSFKLDRGDTNKVEVIDAYAKAKRKAMIALEEAHIWAKNKDISNSRHGRRHISKYGKGVVTLHMMIENRRAIQAVEKVPTKIDVNNLAGQLRQLQNRLDFSTVAINLGRMESELKAHINGYMEVPVLDSDGVQELDALGCLKVNRVKVPPNPTEIKNYQYTVDTLRELMASGGAESHITSTDYQSSERQLIEDIKRQKEDMKRRGITFKSNNR